MKNVSDFNTSVIRALGILGAFCLCLLAFSGIFSGFSVCGYANAEETEAIRLIFVCEGRKFVFEPDYSGLSEEEKSARRIYDEKGRTELIDEILTLIPDSAAALEYVFCGLGNFLDKLDSRFSENPVNAFLAFGFRGDKAEARLVGGKNGRKIDRQELYKRLIMKLKSEVYLVKVPFKTLYPTENDESVLRESFVRGEFSTYCNTANENRTHNIRLALSALDGIKLAPGEIFSFNGIVGERCERRGYRVSKVINNGEYAEGVGGGVCQVSTTLYNAALVAGLEITERHRHTLRSGYVEAGFDAMVNYGGADLRIKNSTGGNVYILTDMNSDGRIRAVFFGMKNPCVITRESVLIADYGKGSVRTDSYLVYTENGKVVKRVKIHGDYYYPNPSLAD